MITYLTKKNFDSVPIRSPAANPPCNCNFVIMAHETRCINCGHEREEDPSIN